MGKGKIKRDRHDDKSEKNTPLSSKKKENLPKDKNARGQKGEGSWPKVRKKRRGISREERVIKGQLEQ